MNEEERADWLARAIDDLLSRDRQRPTEPPPELERQELNALMRIAGERIEESETRLQAGLQYEGEVWQGVLRKLDRRKKPRKKSSSARNDVLSDDQFALEQNLDQFEIAELREIAKMRREMAEQAATIAEAHRDAVWEKVQAALEEPPAIESQRRRFPFFWRKRGEARPVVGRFLDDEQEPDPDDRADLESLMDIANTRRYWSHLAKATAGERQERVWGGVTRTITKDKRYKRNEGGAGWPRAAAFAAVGALVLAAVAPLPATGFADHPFAAIGRAVAEHVGVRETDSRPPLGSGEPGALAGREVTAAEASALLGAAVSIPPAPEGFELEGARFFEEAITADNGGAFVVTYAGRGDAAVAVYQESASGRDLAAAEGTATDVALKDGTAATYVQGAWQPAADGGLTWSDTAGQTLVFERGGLRTTVQYTGPASTAPSLFALADSLAASAE